MSPLNIIVGAICYLILMLVVGPMDKKWQVSLLALCPLGTYLMIFWAGLSAFIPSVIIGHAIGLIIGLLIYRSVDKQVKEYENSHK